MRRWRAAGLAAAVVLGCVAATSAALEPIQVTPAETVAKGAAFGPAHPVLTFGGDLSSPVPVPAARDPLPEVCATDCRGWKLNVATLTPFLVSLRNDAHSTNDGFNLFVYDPNGRELASAAGIGADGQAVVVRPTQQGTYTLAVTMTYGFDTTISYKGEVRLMAGSSWRSQPCPKQPCALLPELQALPPTDLHISGLPPVASTPLGFPLPVELPTASSCYADETVRTGAQRCLRFTSEVDNVGYGILQLELPWLKTSGGLPTSAFVPHECEAVQVVHYTDGSVRRHDAGPCTFHAQHAHFHYNAFVEFGLYAVNKDGTTGALAARSLKESFCLADDGYFGFASRGPNGPRSYAGQPGCNLPSLPTPDALITMGNTPGWGDIYTWDTPDQYIDITHVPPGVYDLVSRANPARRLEVSSTLRSCAGTRIKLEADKATVLRPSVACH